MEGEEAPQAAGSILPCNNLQTICSECHKICSHLRSQIHSRCRCSNSGGGGQRAHSRVSMAGELHRSSGRQHRKAQLMSSTGWCCRSSGRQPVSFGAVNQIQGCSSSSSSSGDGPKDQAGRADLQLLGPRHPLCCSCSSHQQRQQRGWPPFRQAGPTGSGQMTSG